MKKSSHGTVYFSEDMSDAENLVEKTLQQYTELLGALSNEQKQKVQRSIDSHFVFLSKNEDSLKKFQFCKHFIKNFNIPIDNIQFTLHFAKLFIIEGDGQWSHLCLTSHYYLQFHSDQGLSIIKRSARKGSSVYPEMPNCRDILSNPGRWRNSSCTIFHEMDEIYARLRPSVIDEKLLEDAIRDVPDPTSASSKILLEDGVQWDQLRELHLEFSCEPIITNNFISGFEMRL
ncbi:unnamed protein product [Darwinula stevensoni]|uniref:Uncharacterized protein n=1 Tax=Darwinula stevensoni TaxID=69355 RepID=A0A7R8ZY17_9CRUS|nr:unnamed protein product [Darwinula stevensoni]CAG0879531.1 unnamed protein product [Darwinula stevensoni]